MKVAIVCGAPSTEFAAPYEDKDVEIWVLGNRVRRHLAKRVTRIFEIHDNLTEHGDVAEYEAELLKFATRHELIVGESNFNGLLGVTRFPYAEAVALYGSLYLTSSPAYMLAYAILKGATEISIYGVDLSIGDHEYFWQRPCVEAWIGFAKGRGIKVTIPKASHVGKSSYCEGRDWGNEKETGLFTEEAFTAMAAQHKKKNEDLMLHRQAVAIEAAAHDGAAQAYMHLARIGRAVEAKVDVKTLNEATRIQ